MNGLINHPSVRVAIAAHNAVYAKYGKQFTRKQLDSLITVEITHDGMLELIMCDNFKEHDQHGREGPMTIMGFRYYLVDRLPNRDSWRVLNASGND